MQIAILSDPDLLTLRRYFQDAGRDIWAVGGAVRDALLGIDAADIDFATNASPDEQKAIYDAHDIYSIPTGLHHGTWSIRLAGITYEITSFRTETDHDGRWATTHFTDDIRLDLARRDLTINAMAMSFDGDLIDPFGGEEDLCNKVVRFVGNASERIREDYLRILRFLRFHARIAGDLPLDRSTIEAIIKEAPGLRKISRERVWSEMGKIIIGPHADLMFQHCHDLDLSPHLDLPWPETLPRTLADVRLQTDDKVSLMTSYLGNVLYVSQIALAWKWSSRERAQGRLIAERIGGDMSLAALKVRAAVHGEPIEWLAETARVMGDRATAEKLTAWTIPEFPVSGQDMIDAGIPAGKEMGRILHILKAEWGESGFRISRASLFKKAHREYAAA